MIKFKKIFAILLVFTIVIGAFIWTKNEVPASAASENNYVLACNVKQLKKAMKAKQAATIIFRTETYNNITIPSVKAAKNKQIFIVTPNSNVTNKARFSTVTVNAVKTYTEDAKGNTIFWDVDETERLTVAKGKTISKLVLSNWLGYDPYFNVREDAKVKNIEIDTEGYESTSNKKKRTVTTSWEDDGLSVKVTFKFNKNGRITKMSGTNLIREGEYTTTYEYDKSGNLIRQDISKPVRRNTVMTYEYDSDNNLIKVIESKNGEKEYITYYEYDSYGNCTYVSGVIPVDEVDYALRPDYDDNGKIISANNVSYTYDSEGRLTEYINTNSYDGYSLKYYYDKNGFLTKTVGDFGYGNNSVNEYSNDFLGNKIFEVDRYEDEQGYSDNATRTLHEKNEYLGDYKVYEDGFVSPVKRFQNTKEEYEKAGYCVVTNTEEFLDAIAPNAKIILACTVELGFYTDYYRFGAEDFNKSHKYVSFEKNGDGYDLVITGVDNLLISGGNIKGTSSAIYTGPGSAKALKFVDCNGVKLNSLYCSHISYVDVSANLLEFYNCHDVGLYDLIIRDSLYGVAAYERSGNIRVYNSKIQSCEGVCYFSEIDNSVLFANCIFARSNSGGEINKSANYNPDVTFRRCSFGVEESKANAFLGKINFDECLWSSGT